MAAHGSVAIITGAAQGIGFAISEILLQEGYKVCLSDINAEKGRESQAELQKTYAADRIIFVQCDVTSRSSLEEVFTKTQKEFGRIDVVVNNAGIADETNPEGMVATNFMGPIYGCQLALKFMGTKNGGRGGAVVNISSITGVIPHPGIPVYTASKHAVVGLTRSYGSEVHYKENGVTFMAICPYYIRTALLKAAKLVVPGDGTALPALLEPKCVAEGVLMLLKDKRNGSTLMVLPEGLEYTEVEERLNKIKL